MNKYRHEYKYVSPEIILATLEKRARAVLAPDPHAGKNGGYSIRSIYFDDIYNTCYHENENGTDPREKFRIRIYNCSAERISLELKQKENSKTLKLSCPISKEDCEIRISVPAEKTCFKNAIFRAETSVHRRIRTRAIHLQNRKCTRHIRQKHPKLIRYPGIFQQNNSFPPGSGKKRKYDGSEIRRAYSRLHFFNFADRNASPDIFFKILPVQKIQFARNNNLTEFI